MGKTNAFDSACEQEGLEGGGDKHPFLPFKQEGGFVLGVLEPGRAVTYRPKSGKNKGKKVETTFFNIKVTKTNLKGVEEGSMYTISPTGLLAYQLTEGAEKVGVKLPAVVGIQYLGRDDEDRHQTEVRWPSRSN